MSFRELVAATGIARTDADRVADDMYRKVAERFAEDAVITQKERDKLNKLVKALDMDSTRAHRIESDAIAARDLGARTPSNADVSLPRSSLDSDRESGQRAFKPKSQPNTSSSRSERMQARSPDAAENDFAFEHVIGNQSTPLVLDDHEPDFSTDDGFKPSPGKVLNQRMPQPAAPRVPTNIDAKDVPLAIWLDQDRVRLSDIPVFAGPALHLICSR